MSTLNGTWMYQSFRPDSSQTLVPWAPPAKLLVTTDANGRVSGKLVIQLTTGMPKPELVLAVSGRITDPVKGKLPPGVDLTATGAETVFNVRGYFVSGSPGPLVIGTVTAVRDDPGGQPDGTFGPFVLFQ
jgi:hypothetical protein